MPVHWTFPALDAPADAAERLRVEARMDEFWRRFAASEAEIANVFSRQSDLDLPAWMSRWLQPVSAEIMWEFGPPVRGDGHRLVLTAESEHGIRPLVDAMVARAPSLAGWEFFGWRLREDWPSTVFEVESRTGVSMEGARFRAAPSDHGLMDVEVAAPAFAAVGEDAAFGAAVLTVEKLVGERDLNVWVGGIGAQPTIEEPSAGWQQMSVMPVLLDAHKRARIESLPARSFAEAVDAGEWTLWKLQPPERADYPGQLDLFVGKSGLKEIWEGTHGHRAFFAERFVANGETLAYVKLDGRAQVDDERFEDKAAMEDAIDEALRRRELGAFVGGGTGLFYSYLDVALRDVAHGVEVIRDVLTAGNVPRRSWILFEDAHLQREWVPLYPDGPPPPTEEDEASTPAPPSPLN